MASALDAARDYLRRGFMPVPIPRGRKGPIMDEWQKLRLTEDDLPRHFNGGGNLGLLLGDAGGGLIDVDLDCDEAIELADEYLPSTPAETGRASKPRSHRWYRAHGVQTVKHQDPRTRKMIVELRAGAGLQTLVGPSVHPTGELYDMLIGEPATVDGDELAKAVAALAAAVNVQRYGEVRSSKKTAPQQDRQFTTDPAVVERATAYLDKLPEAISGQGGHDATYRAAVALVHGFKLDPRVALELLQQHYNPRCDERWTDDELLHKVEDAAVGSHDKPFGWLLGDNSPASRRVTFTPYQPFPLDVLPEPFLSFAKEHARAKEFDAAYVAMPLLAAAAGSIGNARRARLKDSWHEPCVIWVAPVCESGARKSPGIDSALQHLRARQRAWLSEYQGQWKQYEAAQFDYERARRRKSGNDDDVPKPTPPVAQRLEVNDATMEALFDLLEDNPRGLLLCADELSGWFARFDKYNKGGGGSDAAHWLAIHGAKPIIVDRRTGNRRTVHIPRAAVSIVGGIQPKTLRRVFTEQYRDCGMAARFLLFWPPVAVRKWTEHDVNPNTSSAVARVFDRLLALEPGEDSDGSLMPRSLSLTVPAQRIWRSYYNSNAAEMPALDGDLAALWSKLEGAAARLALVLQLMREPESDAIDDTAMRAAVKLVAWLKGEAERIYDSLAGSGLSDEARRLASWIESRGGTVTVRDVVRGPRQYRGDHESAEAALDELADADVGDWVDDARPQGGATVRRFRLKAPETRPSPRSVATPVEQRTQQRPSPEGEIGRESTPLSSSETKNICVAHLDMATATLASASQKGADAATLATPSSAYRRHLATLYPDDEDVLEHFDRLAEEVRHISPELTDIEAEAFAYRQARLSREEAD